METLDESMPINIGKYEIDWDAINENTDPFEIAPSNKSQIRSPGKTIGATSLETSQFGTPNGITDYNEDSKNNIKVSQLSIDHYQANLNCDEYIPNSLNNSLNSIPDATNSFTNTARLCEETNEERKRCFTKDVNSMKDDEQLSDNLFYNSQDSMDDKKIPNEVCPQNDSIIMDHSFHKSSQISDEQEFYHCQSFMENDEVPFDLEKKIIIGNENPLLDITVIPPHFSSEVKNNIMQNENCNKSFINDIMDTSVSLKLQEDQTNVINQLPFDDHYQNEEFCDSGSFDFLQQISNGGDVNTELRDSIYIKFDPCYEKGSTSPARALQKIGEFLERRASKSPSNFPPPNHKAKYRTPSPSDLKKVESEGCQFETMTKNRTKNLAPKEDYAADLVDANDSDHDDDDVITNEDIAQTVVKVPIRNLAATTIRRPNPTNHDSALDDLGAKREGRHVTRSLDESVLLLKGTPPASANCPHEAYNSGTIVLNKKKGGATSSNPTTDTLFIGPLDYPSESVKELPTTVPSTLQPSSSSNRLHDKPVSCPEAPSSAVLLQWQSKRLLLEREIATLKNKCALLEQGKACEIESLTKALELLEAYKILLLKNRPSLASSPKPGSSSSPPNLHASQLSANATLNDQDYGELLKEKNQLAEDVKGVEVAFADLHRRYEKLKVNLENYKTNEEILRKSLAEKEEKMGAQLALHENYVNHANAVLHEANAEIEKVKGDQKAENMALQAKLKMLEMKTQSLERDLSEKIKENHQLTAMYEELVSNMASK